MWKTFLVEEGIHIQSVKNFKDLEEAWEYVMSFDLKEDESIHLREIPEDGKTMRTVLRLR